MPKLFFTTLILLNSVWAQAVTEMREYKCESTGILIENQKEIDREVIDFNLGYKNSWSLGAADYFHFSGSNQLHLIAQIALLGASGQTNYEDCWLMIVDEIGSNGSLKTKAETNFRSTDVNLPRKFDLNLSHSLDKNRSVKINLSCHVVI